MDVIEKVSQYVCKDFLSEYGHFIELGYILQMVRIYVKSADREWHKENLFLSFLRTVLFARGSEIIVALVTGTSPVAAMADNNFLVTVAVLWWLLLFLPFDPLNKLIEMEVGGFQPFVLLLENVTTVRCIVSVDKAVATTLKKYPKGYIAIFVGTLAGNGTYAVATVFGDFSKTISNEKTTRNSFICAILLSLIQTGCLRFVSRCVGFTLLVIFFVALEVAEAFGHRVHLFQPLYDIIKKVVDVRDLIK